MNDINFEYYCNLLKDKEKESLISLELQNWMVNRINKSNHEGYVYEIKTFVENYNINNKNEKMDFLDYYLEDVYNSILYLIDNLNEKLIKEYLVLPLNKVREFNSKSIMWLNSKPGTTVKQKLKQSQKLLSTRSRMSLDNLENRLFVEYLKRVLYLFSLRKSSYYNEEYLNYSKNEYLEKRIQSFIQREDIKEIKKWNNLPPNNTLISHKYYSKIWNNWNILKKFDEIISKHYKDLERRLELKNKLDKQIKDKYEFCQDFLKIDIENFEILFKDLYIKNNNKKKNKSKETNKLKFAATNFFTVTPSYAYTNLENEIVNESKNKLILNQKKDNTHISCLDAKYIDLTDSDKETYSLLSVLNEKSSYEKTEKINKLIELYKNQISVEEINYIIPDYFDPLTLKDLNKIIKSKFKNCYMIPKSIASLYFLQKKKEFENICIGDRIIVLDIIGNIITACVIKAEENEQIMKNANVSKAFINTLWEIEFTKSIKISEEIMNNIYPLISSNNELSKKIIDYFGINDLNSINDLIIRYKENDFKLDEINYKLIYENIKDDLYDLLFDLEKIVPKDYNIYIVTIGDLFKNSDLDVLMNINEDQINLGCQNYVKTEKDIKKYIKDIILWRIYLPKLSIKLVEEIPILEELKHKINPIIGEKVLIDGINHEITLPANKEKYEFDLIRENYYGDSIFIASIKDYNFPIDQDLDCKIIINYTYGSEEPFEIFLEPKDKKILNKKIKVVLKERMEYEYEGLSIPVFPENNYFKNINDLEKYFKKELLKLKTEEILKLENVEFYESKIINEKEIITPFVLVNSKKLIKFKKFSILNQNNGEDINYEKIVNAFKAMEYMIVTRNEKYNNIDANFEYSSMAKNGNGYYLKINDLYFNSNKFINSNLFSRIKMNINYDLNKNMTPINIRPNIYEEYELITTYSDNLILYKKKLLFKLKELFFGGKSIFDVECSNNLREIFFEIINVIMSEIEKYDSKFKDYKKNIKNILLILMKNIKINNFNEFQEKNKFTSSQLSYIFVDLYKDNSFLDFYNKMNLNDKIILINRSIWWDKTFVSVIPFELVYNILIDTLNSGNNIRTDFFELAYGIFMYRKLNDKEILWKLSLNNPKIRELSMLVEKNKDKKLDNSKLKFNIKNKIDNKIPDLIFALQRVIVGKDDDIVLKEVESED